MTRDEAKKLLPVIQAYADGKDVQYRVKGEMEWEDCVTPLWVHRHEYRIKPEPLECWVVESANGSISFYTSKGAVDSHLHHGKCGPYNIHHMREVI